MRDESWRITVSIPCHFGMNLYIVHLACRQILISIHIIYTYRPLYSDICIVIWGAYWSIQAASLKLWLTLQVFFILGPHIPSTDIDDKYSAFRTRLHAYNFHYYKRTLLNQTSPDTDYVGVGGYVPRADSSPNTVLPPQLTQIS